MGDGRAGAKQIKRSPLQAHFIFVKPPSITVLETRLRERGTETEDAIQARLKTAAVELEFSESPESMHSTSTLHSSMCARVLTCARFL
jgi:guanylate kinase